MGESHTTPSSEARQPLAHTLRDLGIKPGDAVGLYSRNTVEAVEAMVAIFKARAVMVNVNYRYVEGELEHIFTDSGMKVLIHERRYRDKVRNVLQNAPLIERRIVIEDGTTRPVNSIRARAGSRTRSPPRPPGNATSSRAARTTWYMLYTGGTTGKPKGVVWRQEDIWRARRRHRLAHQANRLPARMAPGAGRRRRRATRQVPIPPFIHGGSQWAIFQSLMAARRPSSPEFDAARSWEIVEKHKVNVVFITGDAMGRPMVEASPNATTTCRAW